jgi:hypothetical protein
MEGGRRAWLAGAGVAARGLPGPGTSLQAGGSSGYAVVGVGAGAGVAVGGDSVGAFGHRSDDFGRWSSALPRAAAVLARISGREGGGAAWPWMPGGGPGQSGGLGSRGELGRRRCSRGGQRCLVLDCHRPRSLG